MQITGYGSIQNASAVKKRAEAAQAGGFADLLSAAGTEEAAGVSAPGEVAAPALTNLLALQEISEEDIQRRKLAQRGKNLLDGLENLRRQLLIGTLPPQALRDLNRQLSLHKQQTLDPQLNALIEDIELLAAVELAKLEMAVKSREAGMTAAEIP